jgi:hypothetical protein
MRRTLRILPLAAALALAAPAAGDDDWGSRFPTLPPQRFPDFYPGGAKGAEPSRASRPEQPTEVAWYAGVSLGLELVRWKVEEGVGAFPRYRGEVPSYPNPVRDLPVSTFGYDDVPDGSPPACATLLGGFRLTPDWRIGAEYGYSRTSGTGIAVSHHAFDLTTAVHFLERRLFVTGSLGRSLLVFSDDAGSNLYARFAWGVGIGGTIPLPQGLTLPITLETARSFATKSDDGLPSWSTFRLSVGVAFR